MTARKPSATVGLNVRMKGPLRAQIAKAAKKRGVSLNAETVRRLERSFRAESEGLLAEAIIEVVRILQDAIRHPGGEHGALADLAEIEAKLERFKLGGGA